MRKCIIIFLIYLNLNEIFIKKLLKILKINKFIKIK